MLIAVFVALGLAASAGFSRVYLFLLSEIELVKRRNVRGTSPLRSHRLLTGLVILSFVLAAPWFLIDLSVMVAIAQAHIWRQSR